MSRPRGSRILVLYWHTDPRQIRSAIRQHLRALEASRYHHEIVYWNAIEPVPSWIRHFNFDAVVLHTTFLCMRWSHLFPFWKWRLRWIADLKCPKIALPQDEYDHSEVLDDWLYEWGVDTVFSNFDPKLRESIYPIMSGRATFRKAFTGYIDAKLARRYENRLIRTSLREVDLVYRASHLPYWFGSHGQLKHRLADAVVEHARSRDLNVNVSTREADTIVGTAWLDFLASGKAVLGCESGSSVLDRRGEVRAAIQYLLRETPDLTFEQVDARMPAGWDDHRFFAISPRHFEAVITRTCQVLVEGAYDGVLEADKHYIPLRRDLSNIEEVLDRLENPDELEAMATRAYDDVFVAGRNTYADLAAEMDEILTGHHRVAAPLSWPLGLAALRERRALTSGDESAPVLSRMANPISHWMVVRGRKKLSGEIGPPVVSLRKWSLQHPDRFRIALRALRLDPVLRRLFALHLKAHGARKTVGTGQVLEELLILRMLRETSAGKQNAGEHYRWDVVFDPDKNQLTILSRQPLDPPVGISAAAIRAALDGKATLFLDHGLIGRQLHHALSSTRWVSVPVGPGPLHLRGLEQLARIAPGMVTDAIAVPLPPPNMLARLWSDPLIYGAKGYLAMGAIVRESSIRRIWTTYIGHPRLARRIGPDRMIEDLLKLSLARGQPLAFDYDRESQTLTMTTVTSRDLASPFVAAAGEVRRLIWDNTLLGAHMLMPLGGGKRLDIFVGENSRHEFQALEAMMAEIPNPVIAALSSTRRRAEALVT